MSIRSDDPDATPFSGQPSGADTAASAFIPPPTPPLLPSMPGYEVLEEIARGGMGVVYQARQLGFNRIVALKMILSGSYAGAEERERFHIEAEAVARLQHPNIVQVHEVGEHEGKPFFSMEFCPGGGLDRKLNGTPLPPKEAAALVETLARAVQAAHDKGVVHRDLKPANVLLAEDGTPKVTDFGLAKRMDAEGWTATGAVMGTPSYMAPEQAGGKSKEIGPRTDVYALGAILYECLTGRPPFKGPTTLDTLAQVLADDPVPPRHLQPRTPRDLETICLKCLEKQPVRRYATAAALADDLGRWQRGEPVWAQPPSLGYVLRKQVRRHRTPLAVAAGMLLLLAAVVTTAFVQVLGARDEAQKNYVTADQRRQDVETKQGELQEALQAKQQALDSLNQQLSSLARVYADHGEINWLLRAYQVAPKEDALRPQYARRIADLGLAMPDLVLRQDGPVRAASFSPDSRTILTAGKDKIARLWDAFTGKELQRFSHDDEVLAAAFSPDGRTVLTAGRDKTARLWDAQSGKELLTLKHDYVVHTASFSPDGRTILTASEDKTARLWDAVSGEELHRLTHKSEVLTALFSPDGRGILTTTEYDGASLWDAAAGTVRLPSFDEWAKRASFSPDGRTILTTSRQQPPRLWEAESGRGLVELRPEVPSNDQDRDPLRLQPPTFGEGSFSPDGRTVAAVSDEMMVLWDRSSGKELERFKWIRLSEPLFTPDGRLVVTGALQRPPWDELTRTMAFSPDGCCIVTAGKDDGACLWHLDASSPPGDVDPDRLRAWVLVRTGRDFTPDGRLTPLGPEDLQRQWRTLEAKGGDWLMHPDTRKWHLAQAAEAEADQAWFAARFHLNRLLLTDPNNADLLHRRDEADAHLKAP